MLSTREAQDLGEAMPLEPRGSNATTPDQLGSVDPSTTASQPWLEVIGLRHPLDRLAAEQVSLVFTTYQRGSRVRLAPEQKYTVSQFPAVGVKQTERSWPYRTVDSPDTTHCNPGLACQAQAS